MGILCAGLWMNSIEITGRKYRADEVFYQIGKFIWLPFLAAGFWFAYQGYDRYGELAECSIRKISGLPCPGCGGTRAFYYLFRGELAESFRMNPTVLYGVTAYIHFMALFFVRKHSEGKYSKYKHSEYKPKEIYIPYYMYTAIAVILLQWLIKIAGIILLII